MGFARAAARRPAKPDRADQRRSVPRILPLIADAKAKAIANVVRIDVGSDVSEGTRDYASSRP
jgi:hypothetical protein